MERLDLIAEVDPDDPDSIGVYADGTVDGAVVRFLIDTGGATTSVPMGMGVPTDSERASYGASGNRADSHRVTVSTLTCGPLLATNLVCDVAVQGPAILGLDVLGTGPVAVRLADAVIELDPPAPAAVLPLVRPPDGRPHWYVDVELGEGSLARGILDTGASLTVVDRAWAERHQEVLALTGARDSGTDASGTTIDADRATLGACRIGGCSFSPSAAVVVDLSAMNAHLAWPIDLIIGVPLLRQATWYVDPQRAVWSVTAEC